jgi:RNA polymerase sigma-70 factor (ECF subfamily)
MRSFLAGHKGDAPYPEVAAKLGVSETALRAAIHQMRNRYRAFIEEEVAQTLASRAETKAELEHLQRVLGGMF